MNLKRLFLTAAITTACIVTTATQAKAGYSRCKTVTKEATTPYCFKQGDSGKLIRILVEDLRKAGYYKSKTTTVFNSKVKEAVIKFQKDYRTVEGSGLPVLTADGIVGEDTLVRLCQAVGRGCGPNDDYGCYTGSVVLVADCLDKYKE
ncbi:peptidoglycan-binding protein [Anabaena sp. UHCC 0187]|uniref:peptidoglycan-binding domain-containing protein n=1 Tax=Anabaena sp. UHCC 0187 TaxID=2590018 RepID=UPI0014489F3B|nr:peptidoglycan-binding domain-containing protein [Anabaena sp. UHCC 0187]MTJ14947.1 peptidoglycan-binding protein [Anabaena sp. UHCC 0187]